MRKLFLWVLFLGIVFFLSMQISKEFHAKVLYVSDVVKLGILGLNTNITNAITRHFNQAKQIKELTNTLKSYEVLHYSYEALQSEYNALLDILNTPLEQTPLSITLTRTISYVEINNYSKVWLEYKGSRDNSEDVIFGLIDKDKAAGIATFSNNRLIGYLNGNENCSYSVKIGDKGIPGVAKYDVNKGFIVDYIPLHNEIYVGELIYTSGFDEIFYPGVLVGSVVSVEERQGYQMAIVKPAVTDNAQFYWLVDIENDKAILTQEAESGKAAKDSARLFDF